MKKKCIEPKVAAVLSGTVMGTPVSDEAAFRDIIMKAAQGNIKYQELYLKYIDLISEKLIDEDEVVYEATFIDDEDKNT